MMFTGAECAQARGDPDVVRRHIVEQDLLPLERALPDQALAQTELVRDVARARSWA